MNHNFSLITTPLINLSLSRFNHQEQKYFLRIEETSQIKKSLKKRTIVTNSGNDILLTTTLFYITDKQCKFY